MSTIKVDVFSGERPRISPRLLPANASQKARNIRLTDGAFQPLRAPNAVPGVNELIDGGPKTIYRLYDGATDYWLSWLVDVDVARPATTDNDSFRFMFTGETFPPSISNLAMATGAEPYPDQAFRLGVPKPTAIAGVSATGGVGVSEDRAYVYTHVSPWGEESAPSAASVISTGNSDATWSITGLTSTIANSWPVTAAAVASTLVTLDVDTTQTSFTLEVGELVTTTGAAGALFNQPKMVITSVTPTNIVVQYPVEPSGSVVGLTINRSLPYNIVGLTKRIYRSVATGGAADYFFVGEIADGVTIFSDIPSIAIGNPLETSGWEPPPKTMQGIKVLSSGAAIGFVGKTIHISEPLAPYAWLSRYQFVVDHPIVGLGIVGTAIIVITESRPYVINGLTPESMAIERIDQIWSGVSKEGIVQSEYGVIWPTTEGLARYGIDGSGVLTHEFYTHFEWENVNAEQFDAAYYDNRYYAIFTDDNDVKTIFIYDTLNGGIVSFADTSATAIYSDPVSNNLYIVEGNELYEWDRHPTRFLPAVWQSKMFNLPKPESLSCGQVEGRFFRNPEEQALLEQAVQDIIDLNIAIPRADVDGAITEAAVNTFSLNGSAIDNANIASGAVAFRVRVTLRVGDDEDFYSQIVSDSVPFRLPGGRLYQDCSVQITGAVRVDEVKLSTSIGELIV